MQKIIVFFSFCLIVNFSFAQTNLVPNFSFEQYDTCPNAQDQIQYATGWSKYSTAISTPDYYNTCSSPGAMGVPKSFYIYQPAKRNCSAYAGLVTWGASGNDREYIGIQLSQPLSIGQEYFISFNTVMGEICGGGNCLGMPSNNIGMRLSTIDFDPSSPCPIDNFTHLHSTAIINDSINWQRISGSIIADSAYAYILLGNFFDDSNTTTSPYSCGNCLNSLSYYLVDDICVSTDSVLCNGDIDALLCDVSVSETADNDGIVVFPNPTKDFLSVSFQDNQKAEIILFDVFGNTVYTKRIENINVVDINISSFSSGTYFLKITYSEHPNPYVKKIIKI
jgi:hypothetical protein